MIYESNQMETQAVLQTAASMCAAARTAPKAHGKDTVCTLVLTGEEKEKLADKMTALGKQAFGEKDTWITRDADNVRQAQAVVLIGVHKTYRGVPHCSFCGFANCEDCKEAGANCAFAYVDLGIALCAAVSAAAAQKADNRIMFSVGKAAMELDYLNIPVLWHGIPLSVWGKNIFFDRKIQNIHLL